MRRTTTTIHEYTFTDDSGRVRWIAPDDDPEPRRAGPDGFLSKEWAAWEARRMERRQKNIPPDRLMSEPPELSALDVHLNEMDGLIAQAADVVEGFGRARLEVRQELDELLRKQAEAAGRQGWAGSIPAIPAGEKIRRLRGKLEYLDGALSEARAFESEIRGIRNKAASATPRRPNDAIEYHPGWNATYNPVHIVDGALRRN